MSPDRRREALVDATLRELDRLGRTLSTREIADAAGVAEGTIFRIFDTKDALIDAAVEKAFDPTDWLALVDRIDLDQPLPARLRDYVALLQQRFTSTFRLMSALGMTAPPIVRRSPETNRRMHDETAPRVARLVGDDADRLRVPPERLAHYLRLLTFSGSHSQIAHGQVLAAEEIVDIVLHGMLQDQPKRPARPPRPRVSSGGRR